MITFSKLFKKITQEKNLQCQFYLIFVSNKQSTNIRPFSQQDKKYNHQQSMKTLNPKVALI